MFGTTVVECASYFLQGHSSEWFTYKIVYASCMLHSLCFCICVFVHLYYCSYLRMLKMYSYLYLFLLHNDKVTNKQSFSFFIIKICLYLYVHVCLSFDTDRFLKQHLVNKNNIFFQCEHGTKVMVCNISFYTLYIKQTKPHVFVESQTRCRPSCFATHSLD